MDSKITPKRVVVPRVNDYAIYSQLSLFCQQSLLAIVVFTSGIELMNSFDLYEKNLRQGEIRQQNKETRRTFIDDINAIACGVEAWFEETSGYSKSITETTIEIARKLGVPDNEIRRWVARRSTFSVERARRIKSFLERQRASPDQGGVTASR